MGRIRSPGSDVLTRLDRRARLFAVALAAVAGYVDAAGFLITGGYFVSFMSGNSTRLGVGLMRNSGQAALAAGLIAAFVAGVVAGASIRRLLRRRAERAILLLVSGTLALCALLAGRGLAAPAALLLAGAMGAENTIFAEAGEVRIGLTYMTGALVKVGKGLAAALFREAPFLWTPHLLLWLGLIAGAALGATAFSSLGLAGLWLAAVATALLALLSPLTFPAKLAQPEPSGQARENLSL